MLSVGLLFLFLSLTGCRIAGAFLGSGDPGPETFIASGHTQRIAPPDGDELQVRTAGVQSAPTLVLTHGWSLNKDEWGYVQRDPRDRFRIVTWDLRGLGESRAPANNDYALERMAEDLDAVVRTAGPRVVLVGHSIGEMINLTYCKPFPQRLGREVAGIVQLNTTYTDPAKTTKNAERQVRLQNSIGEPLLQGAAALSPIIRVLNRLAYQSGLLHAHLTSSSFAGTETRGQLDYAARTYAELSPAVIMRGTLGMLHWDASDVLARVNVPVLIVTADGDTTTVPAASEHMRSAIRNARLRTERPGAHLAVLERNREYDQAIADFASEVLR